MALTPEQEALDFNPELQDVSRQRKLAELLMAKGLQQPQGQMISGHYVAPSWTQQLNPMANMLAGEAVGGRADTKQQELAVALRGKQQQVMQAWSQAKTPQEKFAIGTSEYAPPQLKAATYEMLKPQNVAEGASIQQLNMGTGAYDILAQGGQKLDPDTRRAMQFLKINKPIEQLTDQELQAVERKAIEYKKAGASNVSLNIPTEGERKSGFMANILDRNILQMQNALGVDPSAVKPNVPASVVEAITGPNLLSRTMKPAQRQIIEDSQLDVLDAALTLRTGAAYTPVQLAAMRDTYFPKLGDKPAAITAKRQRLESLLEGAYISSGRATPPRNSNPYALPPAQPNANQQLNIPNMKLPPGVTPQLWNVMTPEEKAAFK
jgi:hypothetical protein